MSRLTWTKPGPVDLRSSDSRDRVLDPEPVDVAHREHGRVQLAEQRALAVVERADADERDPARVDRRDRHSRRRRTPARRGPSPPRAPSRGRSRSGSSRAGSGRRARRSRARRPGRRPRGEPAERAERDRVVAAEDERQPAPRRCAVATRSATRPQAARISSQVPRPLVADRRRLGHRRLDVAEVDAVAAELARSARRAPRSGSPTGPCPRRGGRHRDRGPRR